MNRKLISLTTAFAIILISSVVALADSPDDARVFSHIHDEVSIPNDSFQLVIPDEYFDSAYLKLATGDVRATSYSTTDIYNLLDSALKGENYLSIYSLPKVTSYVNRIAQTLYGSGQSVPTTSLYSIANSVLSRLSYNLEGTTVGVGNLLGEIMYDTIDIKTYNSNISSKLSSIDSQFDIPLSEVNSVKWTAFSPTYYGVSLGFDTNYISNAQSTSAVFQFSLPTSFLTSEPCMLRLALPMYCYSSAYSPNVEQHYWIDSIKLADIYVDTNIPSYFFEPCEYGTYLYLYNFNFVPNVRYSIKISSDQGQSLTNYPVGFSYLGYNDSYQLLKIANKFDSLESDLSAIRQVVASPDKVHAEQAQQGVESQVLDDFTGQGSESMTLNDVGGVKNVSSNAKQFLGTGSSGSNALSVFNVNGQGLWQWFSQTTADNLDSTTPTRGSDGYLTIYDQNMQSYLDGLGGDENAR